MASFNNEKTVLLGLDFGSHTSSIALWSEEKGNSVEVIADDLGSRTIPCAVAFRGDEILTGSAAITQSHKNPSNTFLDIRTLLFDPAVTTVNVPALEKEIPVTELASHFFRNIHNQVKQQVGKPVRECVVSVPQSMGNLEENGMKQRLLDAAQAGGIRVKCTINDGTATLLANVFDDATIAPAKVLVVDLGWSRSEISLYNVSGGLFFLLATQTSVEMSGNKLVHLLSDHCAKDFARKAKFPCNENARSMMRLRRDCEDAIKALSTGTEATIDIDSLCEGVDFSGKISRARFEDLCAVPFMHLKNVILATLTAAGVSAEDVDKICMCGGLSANPKAISVVKGVLPDAISCRPRGQEPSESQSIGAALQGKTLSLQGLLDKAPTQSPTAAALSQPLYIKTEGVAEPFLVLPVDSVVPVSVTIPVTIPTGQAQGYFQLLEAQTKLGEVVFSVGADAAEAVAIVVAVSTDGEVKLDVTQAGSSLASLVVPKK